jgi:hypothetical protein
VQSLSAAVSASSHGGVRLPCAACSAACAPFPASLPGPNPCFASSFPACGHNPAPVQPRALDMRRSATAFRCPLMCRRSLGPGAAAGPSRAAPLLRGRAGWWGGGWCVCVGCVYVCVVGVGWGGRGDVLNGWVLGGDGRGVAVSEGQGWQGWGGDSIRWRKRGAGDAAACTRVVLPLGNRQVAWLSPVHAGARNVPASGPRLGVPPACRQGARLPAVPTQGGGADPGECA